MAPDATTASFPLVDAYRKQLGLKALSEKSGRCGDCSRLASVALYLWLIVVISVRQSTVAAISGLHRRALAVSSSIRLTAWLQNSKKRAERSEIDVWAESPRLSPLCYLHHRLPVMRLLIITVITPLPTKPSADKNARELKLANVVLLTCGCVSVMLLPDAKNYQRVVDAALKMMLCVMMLPLVVGCTSKQSVSQCVKPPPPPAWIMQPPPTGRHRWTGLFHPQERGWSLCKTTGRNPEVY